MGWWGRWLFVVDVTPVDAEGRARGGVVAGAGQSSLHLAHFVTVGPLVGQQLGRRS